MPKVTIDDIAKQAGVSKTSVSFAFNYPERLSAATLKHIRQIANELGYTPDPLASNLKTGRTGCIGLLVPQPIPIMACNPHTFELIEGIGLACHEAGVSLMLVPPLKGNLRHAVSRAAVDGFLTMGLEPFDETLTVLHQRHVPFVMIDSDPAPGLTCVNIDDRTGAYAAMSYVLNHGHRRILLLGILSPHDGNFEAYTGSLKRRITGYQQALAEAGLDFDGDQVRFMECEVDSDAGYHAFETVWEEGGRPTAVVTMADVLALGVMRAARNLGLTVPDQLSLVGYDDIEAGRLVQPPLTTVHQPTVEKGRVAADLLIDLINEKPLEPEQVVLPVEMVLRQSCRTVMDAD